MKKRNIFRRAVCILLALCLLCALLPQTAPAARAEDAYSGSCGTNLTWRFDPDTGELTIEGSGDMSFFIPYGPPVLHSPWHAFAGQIVSVSLPEGLTSISWNAFLDCSALASVTIPEGVISLGASCFEGCSSLGSVTIPEGVERICSSAFAACKSLTELSVPSGVTHVDSRAFAACDALRAVTFLNPMCEIEKDCLDSSVNVTVYGYAGSAAESLAEGQGLPFVSLGSADYSGACGDDLIWTFDPDTRTLFIEGSGDMWLFGAEDAEARESPWHFISDRITVLDLPEGLTTIENQAFRDCSGLTSVTVPSTVTKICDLAFNNCYGLISAELPEGLIYCSGFAYCDNLSEVTIPSTVTVIGYKAFCSCYSLTEIEIPDGVTHIDWAAFRSCYGLTEITLPDGLVEIDNEAFSHCDGLTKITLPDSLVKIGSKAFFYCNGLTEITLPDSLVEIGEEAFSGCRGLTEMTFPASVSSVGGEALDYCNNLTAVTFFNPSCEIGYDCLGENTWATIFGWCGSTAEAYAEEHGNPFVYLDADDMQGSCGDDLTWTYDPAARTLSIQGSGDMWDFGDCYQVPWYSFSTHLNTVCLPEGLTHIGDYAFTYCEELTGIVIPGSVDSIGFDAFDGCSALGSVTLQEGLRVIGEQAFYFCSSLTEVTLPESLEMVGMNAFLYCFDLRQVVIRNPDCEICAAQECGARSIEYDVETENTLGLPEQTVIYVLHDAEKENAELFPKTLDTIWGPLVYGFRYAESYAKTYGYTYYALGVFDDVRLGKYYEIPVAWAYANGITSGTWEGTFSPSVTCTREQIVTFLWKACGAPEPHLTANPFTDVQSNKYYYKAVLWAAERGITGGVGNGKFGVGQGCTREQAVTFLWKAAGAPKPQTAANPFRDVEEGKWYFDAVLWAVEKGVTSGMSADTFGVRQTCTRAQIVTFLYKAYSFPEGEG